MLFSDVEIQFGSMAFSGESFTVLTHLKKLLKHFEIDKNLGPVSITYRVLLG